MNDMILTARLDVLEKELERAENPSSWRDQLNLQNVDVAEMVWTNFNGTIRDSVRAQLKKIRGIREELEQIDQQAPAAQAQTLKQAWQSYTEVFKESQEIFCECVEFIGGLAFRDKLQDASICQVADEIISACANSIRQWPSLSLTVPAGKERLTKTLGRIVRLRFPGWTIWTLPFVAHEFGHVIEADIAELRSLVDDEVNQWIKDDLQKQTAAWVKRHMAGDERAQPRAEGCYKLHVQEFIADSFATFTMGPAYACSAIFQRFDPSDDFRETDERPSDIRRAYVVLAMLQRMNDGIKFKKPYTEVLAYLRQEWQAILASSMRPGTLDATDQLRLDNLVKKICDTFYDKSIDLALYSNQHEDEGWIIAQRWYEIWRANLENAGDLPLPKVARNSKVRDVLNAAWLYRVYDWDQEKDSRRRQDNNDRIAKAAHGLCRAILTEQKRPSLKEDPKTN